MTTAGDAKQGRYAVTWDAPSADTTAALNFTLTDAQQAQVARAQTLTFWYRFDGASPPESFMIKIIAAPLAGGWQAIYNVPAGKPGEWKQATVAIQDFEDQWGDRPDLTSGTLMFRVSKKQGQEVRLTVDDIRLTPLAEGVAINKGKEPVKVTPLISSSTVASLTSHPRLMMAAADVPAVRRRATSTEWGRAFVAGLRQRCDAALTKPVTLPDRGGQWYHWYACPKHGTRLKAESPTRHVCPTGGEVYTGYPYDDVYISTIHDGYAGTVRDLGLLYQVTGEKRYAEKAKEILLAYAAKYKSYPLHDINGKPNVGGGKVGPQTLDESTWLILMAQGCDAIWDALSPPDIETLKTGLFYPATDVIRQHKMSVHNIQCWKNSAVGLVGLMFGDATLLGDAVDEPQRGLQTQILQGITDDGPWYEGAWGYHFYTMSAIAPLAEALEHAGISIYTGKLGERYKSLYTAPLDLMMPDGRLPAFNDSGSATAMGNHLYEFALARWKDPRFAAPLATGNRQNANALLVGADTLPKPEIDVEPSRNYVKSGYAILRTGTAANTAWLCLKYGPHGGGHGHPDKLNFVFFEKGRVLADDPGTAAYGVPIQAGWYRTTFAHNTLVVDEESQKPAAGRCLDFRPDAGAGAAAVLADAGAIYPGISYRRAAFLLPDGTAAFLDMVRCEDGKPRTLDIALHAPGAPAAPSGQSFTPPDRPGYSYLRDVHTLPDTAAISLALTGDSTPTRIAFAPGGVSTTYLVGTGVGKNTEDRVPILVARRQAANTSYAWALGASSTPIQVAGVPVLGSGGSPVPENSAVAARVRTSSGTYLVIANPEGGAVRVGGWSGSDRVSVVKEP